MHDLLSLLFISALPAVSVLAGGLLVHTWKKDLHPLLSLSGGILLGVAFLDLLPEALEHGVESGLSIQWILGISLIAILAFHILDKALSFHAHHQHAHNAHHHPEETCHNESHTRAYVRAGSIIFHSLLDGIAIGASFASSTELGILVTLAVILHDFADGMSTVTFLKHGLGHEHRRTLPILGINALAPFAGVWLGTYLGLEDQTIAILLALFSGFFIFLALSELLPQAHSGKMSKTSGVVLTLIGIILVIFIRQFAHV